MNEKISRAMFRESLDRCSSGVHADPYLAGRILASGKGELKMKRKMFTSVILALVIILVLATVAYSAATIYRMVNYKGETLETLDGPDNHEYPEKARDYDALCDELIDNVPDEECGIFRVNIEPGHYVDSVHKKQVQFSSFEEFTGYMEKVHPEHIAVPVWLPEYRTFHAKVFMDLKEDGLYERVAYMMEGDAVFAQYRFAEGCDMISGYSIILDGGDEDARVEITAELSGSKGETQFMVGEGETEEPVVIQGVDDALLIRSSNPLNPNRLYMQSNLDREFHLKTPGCLIVENPDPAQRSSFFLTVCDAVMTETESRRDPETLMKIFTGEQ